MKNPLKPLLTQLKNWWQRRKVIPSVPSPSRLPTLPPPFPIVLTYIIGCLVSLAILGVGLLVLSRLGVLNWITGIALAVAIFSYIGWEGFVNVPTQPKHRGVPILLGKRIESWTLSDGFSWILPRPIMDVLSVNIAEQQMQIPKAGDRELTAPAIGWIEVQEQQPDGAFKLVKCPRPVVINIRMVIRWRIVNPYRFLDLGSDVVVKNIGDLGVKSVRQLIPKNSDIEVLQSQDPLEIEVTEEMINEANKQGTNAVEGWGVEILGVMLPRLLYNSTEVIDDYESVTREQQQRVAETIEQEFLLERAKKLKDELGLSGTDALYAVHRERGKMATKQVVITTEGGSPLGEIPKAVALFKELGDGK